MHEVSVLAQGTLSPLLRDAAWHGDKEEEGVA
jgi:hypothetical protein